MKHKDFVALILTHGRPHKQLTYRSLRKAGYTGPIALVVDNEDPTRGELAKQYPGQVVTFDKLKEAQTTDAGDNFPNRKALVYARNASFGIAEQLGYKTFVQLDDDYTSWYYKADGELQYCSKQVKNLDAVFDAVLDFFEATKATSVALAQGGDFIGGTRGRQGKKLHLERKCMNTWFCSVERPFKFYGRMNEDVSTYVCSGRRGHLFLHIPNVAVMPAPTQQTAGGMTELYLQAGTYVKSFYTVMYAPSCVKVGEMGPTHRRLHHRIEWPTTAPKIVSEKWRKAA